MYVVTVDFKLQADRVGEFITLIGKNARMSVQSEPGCHQFDVCLDPKDPAYVFLYEIYDDRAAFEAHLATEHFKTFDQVSNPMVLDKRVRLLERA